jgi:hypothetical protein
VAAFHRNDAEEKTENSVWWNKKLSKFSEKISILFAGTGNFRFESLSQNAAAKISKIVSEKTTFEVGTNHFVKLFWLFCKTIFLHNSVPYRASQLTLPWTSECLVMSTFSPAK